MLTNTSLRRILAIASVGVLAGAVGLVAVRQKIVGYVDRVLPRLSRSFHVFAVDYPGHGDTVVPADYPMTAEQIGGDLGDFVETVVGGPA